MMDPSRPNTTAVSHQLARHALGAHGPGVTTLGLGCAPLGNLFAEVSDEDARATVDAAWDAGIRFFDTAPLYGSGLSETRTGAALAHRPRSEYVLASKVGHLLREIEGRGPDSLFPGAPSLAPVFDFTRDGVLRSIEESLDRLDIDRLDIVHVHDPDDHEPQALTEAFPALIALRDEGVIGAVGCGMNQTPMLLRIVERVDLDAVLLAGRYTLLDRSGADQLLPRCAQRGIGVIIGGVFNSGLLADPDVSPTYDYKPAPITLVERARRMRAICENAGVTLAGAAIQFPLRHPAVTSVVVGARSAQELASDVAQSATTIPDDVWAQLEMIS